MSQRTGRWKSVGTAPTDPLTAGRKPLGSQRETVREPFPLGFSGYGGVKGESRYLRATFFSSALLPFLAQALVSERVVSLCFSSHQQLDCWDSALPFRAASRWTAGALYFRVAGSGIAGTPLRALRGRVKSVVTGENEGNYE